ncbi:MAG: c-type cytochrome [Gemmatimonadetes bacterium]|nr:c-type cytochrome [Gemmatimonadota bacterium]
MRRVLAVLTVGLTGAVVTAQAAAQQGAATAAPPAPPAAITWAYPLNPPAPAAPAGAAPAAAPAPAPDPTQLSLPGATAKFTRAQIGAQQPADWRPETHPAMPDIVANGRTDVRACALCHYPNGQGRPENGPVAGLPAQYIIQQLVDFQSGARKSSEPRMGPPAAMVRLAKAMTPEEMAASADYFASFSYKPWVQVKEATTVPKLKIVGGMFMPAEGTEAIGNRVVEVPEFPERTELRDPIAGFIAYVPPGTLAKGEAIANGGAGRAACAACHGPDLRGLGPVPPIAGRTVSYLTRQLYDFKSGARAGAWAALMMPIVHGLSEADMMAVAAYAASMKP